MAWVPIKPAVLKWAMVEANSSPEDVARATKRDVETVNAWLAGSKKPTKGDVSLLAKRLGRSVHFFLLPAPPERSGVDAWYRAAVRGEPDDRTSELNEVRAARRRQRLAEWALHEVERAERVTLPTLSAKPEAAARELREHLGWSTRQDQVRVTNKNATFKALRDRVEGLGIIVQLRPIGIGNSRGFSLPNAFAPMIVINSSHTLGSVRSFTLLHELAHLCRGEDRVCYERNSGEEAYCNRVAANFLMPATSLREYLRFKGWREFSDDDTDPVRLIANRYNTSRFSVAIRLTELGLAGQGLIETIRDGYESEWIDGHAGGGSGGEPYTRPLRRIDEFGSTYTSSLLMARDTGSLSELEMRRQLRVSGTELSAVAQLARSRAV